MSTQQTVDYGLHYPQGFEPPVPSNPVKYKALKLLLRVEDVVGYLFAAIAVIMVIIGPFVSIETVPGEYSWSEPTRTFSWPAFGAILGLGLFSALIALVTFAGAQLTRVFIDMESSLSEISSKIGQLTASDSQK